MTPPDVVPPLRVVVAEDNLLVREGLRSMLATEDGIEVVAVAERYEELMAAVSAERPDAVLTDIRMPPTLTDEGVRAAAEIRAEQPDVGVVVLSQYDDPEFALALLGDGSRGRAYLLKERMSDPAQLVGALREVCRGGSVVDPKVVDALVRARSGRSATSSLTPRERDVLAEMATGKDNTAIAATLVLSVRAVEKNINAIFSKLGLAQESEVHKRVKAVLLHLAEEG